MTQPSHQNLFTNLPATNLPDELMDTLCNSKHVKIKRIISTGQASPASGWYEQKQNEFVIVLSGHAIIQIENEKKEHTLTTGDYLILPAKQRHRVTFTSPDKPTVWLAIYFD